MDDHSVLRLFLGLQQGAEGIAFPVRQMLRLQQRVAEGQPGRNAVFLHQGQNLPGICLPIAHPAAAPKAAGRRAVNGPDVAPAVKVLPVLPIQRQKHAVQLVKLKQAGKMVVCGSLFSMVLLHKIVLPPFFRCWFAPEFQQKRAF